MMTPQAVEQWTEFITRAVLAGGAIFAVFWWGRRSKKKSKSKN